MGTSTMLADMGAGEAGETFELREPSEPHASSSSSLQPGMIDHFDTLDTTWDGHSSGMQFAPASVLLGDSEHNLDSDSSYHLASGPPHHIVEREEAHGDVVGPPVSIFGHSSGALDNIAGFTSTIDFATRFNSDFVTENVTPDGLAMHVEKCHSSDDAIYADHERSRDGSPADNTEIAYQPPLFDDDNGDSNGHQHILDDFDAAHERSIEGPPGDGTEIAYVPPPFDDHDEDSNDLQHILDEIDELDQRDHIRKKLRPQAIGQKRKFNTTWIDKDDSGNYDPKEERRLENAKRARRKAASRYRSRAVSEVVTGSETEDTGIGHVDGEVSEQCIVVLNFTTRTGTEAFRSKVTNLAVQQATLERNHELQRLSDAGVSGRNRADRTIITSFSHPVIFNCDDDEPAKDCHFCTWPALAFFGYGKKNTSVIVSNECSGFLEVASGHREQSIQQTALCTECTTSRLSIIMCERHEMTPIVDLKFSSQDEERIQNSLYNDDPEAVEVNAFCSLCHGKATQKCGPGQECDADGCGLKLCESCTVMLVGKYDGQLGAMLVGEEVETSEGFRADAELLVHDGVLVRCLTYLSRQ